MMLKGIEATDSIDSLIGFVYNKVGVPAQSLPLPSSPKPGENVIKPRRASVVCSPYLKSVVSSAPNTVKKKVPKKRTRTLNVNVFEEHFSGKNVFDLRDELTNTKRTLSVIKRERDAALIECSKLKSLLDKKEKDIEDLFIGGHVSNVDKNKVVSGTKNDTLLTLSSLRHRLHSLERSLREKEATITSLRSDIKATRLKEMEIEKETYYEEILRLQRVAEGLQMEMDEQVPMSKKQLHERVTELEKVLGEVVSRYEKVKKDRDKLREVLDHWEENGVSYPANDEKASKYMTLTQGAAVSALVQMDLTLTDKMERINFLEQNLELQKKDNEALSNDMQECNNENERQIKQLTDLKEKSSNIEQMCIKYKKDLEQTQENLTLELAAHERTKGTLKCLQEELENELVAREFFQKMNKKRTQKLLSSKQQISTAATIIQYRWRLYKSYKRQKEYDCQQAESIIKIQNILRAHNVRIAVLSNQKSHLVKTKSLQSCDHSNTVNVIQTLNCVLLGHVTRKVFLTNK